LQRWSQIETKKKLIPWELKDILGFFVEEKYIWAKQFKLLSANLREIFDRGGK